MAADNALDIVEQLHNADDRQNAGILDVDNQVIADLGHDIAQCLGQNDIGHDLHVIHANGHGAFGLTGIDGKNTAPDCFRHIGARY